MRKRTTAAVIALGLSTACASGAESRVEDTLSGGIDVGRDTDGDAGGSGDGDDSGGEDGGVVSPEMALPTRRLTRRQYSNVLADLLGDMTDPGAGLGPDAPAFGYDSNGVGESIALLDAERYEVAAKAAGERALGRLGSIMLCDVAGGAEEACVDQFIEGFGLKAFRRPLDDATRDRLRAFYDEQRQTHTPQESARLLLEVFLMSPRFLYRLEPPAEGRVDDWTMASRLSFFLWNTTPDAELLAAAANGELATAQGVQSHAQRMLQDPRAEDMVRDFHRQWLSLDWVFNAAKDEATFPAYTAEIQDLLVEETLTFAAHQVLVGDGTLTSLLTAPSSFLNDELAAYYGVASPGGPLLSEMSLDPARAAGVLTQGAFLASHASATETAPSRRGKFIRERLLCGEVPPPPPGLDASPPPASPGTTTRERYRQHAEDPVCAACHALTDPLGLGFEHYDAIGRWRDDENGLPIDTTVEIAATDEQTNGVYAGVPEMVVALAASRTTRACVARQWLRYAYGRDDGTDAGQVLVDTLMDEFADGEGDIVALIVGLTQTDAFLGGRS